MINTNRVRRMPKYCGKTGILLSKQISRKDYEFDDTRATNLYERAIPYGFYCMVKDAVAIMNRPGWSNERKDIAELEKIERRIHVHTSCVGPLMPWIYDRKTASSFIADYERIFNIGVLIIV